MTSRKYLALDLEIAALIPDGETDWKQYRPLGITCWALAWINEHGVIQTHAYSGVGVDQRAPRMSKRECAELVSGLVATVIHEGYTLLTHNGVGFDFDILAEESGMHKECAELAMNSVDTCLFVHCLRGYPVGLEAICKGMGIKGKVEGMSGSLAPQMWQEGKYEQVLEYVQQDVRCTLEVALAIEQRRGLRWISKSGRLNSLPVRQLLTVSESLQLPEPDTSWMDTPIPRSRFTGWMDAIIQGGKVETNE